MLIVGASRSKPHTGDTNRDFPFICVYNIYICRTSFRTVYSCLLFQRYTIFHSYTMRMHYPICIYIYEAIAQGSSELIQQLKNERAKKEERLRKTSKERSQKNTCGDTRTERQDYREKRDGVQARPPRSRQS